jgi:hypothetical protein
MTLHDLERQKTDSQTRRTVIQLAQQDLGSLREWIAKDNGAHVNRLLSTLIKKISLVVIQGD